MGEEIVLRESNAIEKQDPAAIAAAEKAKARIQSAYIMAYRNPRDTEQARVKILNACKRHAMAERAEYSKPVGSRHIKGPSVRLAELAIREWGNILTDTQVLYEDDDVRRMYVSVTDLETNASFGKEIQIRKTVERKKADQSREIVGERTNTNGETVYIVRATEDELHNKEAAMISKVVRNEGLRLIPSDIIDEALDTARSTIAKRDKEDPDAAKKRLINSFSDLGVMPKDIEKFLGTKLDQINPADLQKLRGIYQAIKDGETTWREVTAERQPAEKPALPESTGEVEEKEQVAELVDETPKKRGRPPKAKTGGDKDGELFNKNLEVKASIRDLCEALGYEPDEISKIISGCKDDPEKLEAERQKYLKAYNEQRDK